MSPKKLETVLVFSIFQDPKINVLITAPAKRVEVSFLIQLFSFGAKKTGFGTFFSELLSFVKFEANSNSFKILVFSSGSIFDQFWNWLW